MFVCVLEETLPEPHKHMMVLVMGTRVINDARTVTTLTPQANRDDDNDES